MNTFESNVMALATKAPALAEAIRDARGGFLSVAPARSGKPTATAGGRSIHSAYDPWREAESWAKAQAGACRAGEVVIVLGVGLLYHVEALRLFLPREMTVGVVVPDMNELHDACMARPL